MSYNQLRRRPATTSWKAIVGTGAIAVAIVLASAAVLPGAAAQEPPVESPPATLPPFDTWLTELRAEAVARGIRQDVIDAAFADIQPVAQILERDRTQAEFALDLTSYLKRRLTRATVRTAQQMHNQHRALIDKVGKQVRRPAARPHRGLGPRVELRPLRRRPADDPGAGHARLRSAARDAVPERAVQRARDRQPRRHRAGAAEGIVGRRARPAAVHAVDLPAVTSQDFDGDGRRDIWTSQPDVFASIAFYLREHGWSGETTWGREVKVPKAARRPSPPCRGATRAAAPSAC